MGSARGIEYDCDTVFLIKCGSLTEDGVVEKISNSGELMQRLQQASGEDVILCGWGTLGMKNVFAGVTPSAIFLEYVTLGLKTKELMRIPFEEIEFIWAASGDASTPALMKLNLESRINEAMTGTLLFRVPGGKLTNILFRKMPRFDKNDKTPFRITEYIASLRPELVHLPELSTVREKQSFGGCMKNFLMISAVSTVILASALGFGTGQWDMAMYGGLGTGVVLGAVFAPLIPVFKRMISGRG